VLLEGSPFLGLATIMPVELLQYYSIGLATIMPVELLQYYSITVLKHRNVGRRAQHFAQKKRATCAAAQVCDCYSQLVMLDSYQGCQQAHGHLSACATTDLCSWILV